MELTHTIKLRQAGASDLHLSNLGLGCWAFGGGQYWGSRDQSSVDAVVRRAVELGVNYFDTAESYNEGRSEESLGLAIRCLPREKLIIGTKVSPANVTLGALEAHCDASLRRLRTDYIDLYMVHWPIKLHAIHHFDPTVTECPSAEAAFEGLMRLQAAGKIRHIGVSNFAPTRLMEALATGVKIVVNELPYNLLCRGIEWEVLPWCRQAGIGVIGYMALLQGVLADIYPTLDDVPVWQRRTRHFDCRKCKEVRHGEHGAEEETAATLVEVRRIGREQGLTMPQVAMKWAVASHGITCALAGVRTVEKLEENIHAVSEPLPQEIVEKLNRATESLKQKLGPSLDYYENPKNDRTI